MVVGAKVCELTEDLLWFVCGLYVGILTSPLTLSGDALIINMSTLNSKIYKERILGLL